mgnify:CR=1 FL=1
MKKEFRIDVRQVQNFVLVGAAATLVDWSIFFLLVHFPDGDPLKANVVAFLVSVVFNYRASSRWVFAFDENKSDAEKFSSFLLPSLVGLAVSEGIIYLGVNVNHLEKMPVKIAATAISMVINFVTRKLWLEKKDEK